MQVVYVFLDVIAKNKQTNKPKGKVVENLS